MSDLALPLTRARLSEAAYLLASKDEDLAQLLKTDGVPPLWSRPQGFRTLIRIVLEQQVSLASADAVFRRLVAGVRPFAPDRFVELGESHLRSLGITRQKSRYCVGLAEALLGGDLDLKAIAKMDDSAATASLMRQKGVGKWTADIYLLMACRRPDIWPVGDVALVTTVMQVKRLRERPSNERMVEIAKGWLPYRAVAARMLWQHYLACKKID